jgi:hypothetical protein
LLIGCLWLQLKRYAATETLITIRCNHQRIFALICCVLLMPFNWLIEAVKWKYINDHHQYHISIGNAFRAVILGASAGLLSPGRWGEPVARAYYGGNDKIVSRTYWNLPGIAAQWSITILGGAAYLFFYGPNKLSPLLHVILFVLIGLVTLTLYYFHDQLLVTLFNYKPFQWLLKIKQPILFLNLKTKQVIISLTFVRFMVYLTQYVILIFYFSEQLSVPEIMLKMFFLFFLQSFSIFPGWIDIGIKGNIAIYLFASAFGSMSDLLFVILFIWILNLFIPALIGYLLFYKKLDELSKQSSKEKISR